MGFPSLSGTRPGNLSYAWDMLRGSVQEVKNRTQTVRTMAAAGTTSGVILDHTTFLAGSKEYLNSLASTPGLADYAKGQVNDATFDIVTEYVAMMTALDNTVTWIMTNFPKDASGFLLAKTFDANGVQVDRNFDAASLSTFVTVLDALLATID